MKKPLIILTGPTAVGKTALSISLAKAVGGEIISADSMQVYKGLDIGSAKIKPHETKGVPHHLIDVLNPDESFDVVRFKKMANEAMDDIYRRGGIPIITGGTGFYIQAVLYDIDFTEVNENQEYRQKLKQMADEQGPEVLHRMLREADPEAAEQIHANNVKRVIRALEYYKETGEPISRHNEAERKKVSPYEFCYFVLNDDRQKLYDRIDERVDQMLSEGLVDEVRALKDRGLNKDTVSMKGLGYKEILGFLNGEYSYEEAVRILKRDTRHFAKRQLTWFKRERDVIWINKPDFAYDENKIRKSMVEIIQERGLKNEAFTI